MDQAELRNLRIKQLLLVNGTFLVTLVIYVACVAANISQGAIQFGIGLYFLLVGIIGVVTKRAPLYWFPSMKKLTYDEKEKMGAEWNGEQVAAPIIQIVLGLMFTVIHSPPFSGEAMEMTNGFILFILCLFVVVAVLVNFKTVWNHWKVDQSTTEQREVSDKSTYFKLFIGIGICWLVLVILLIVVFIS